MKKTTSYTEFVAQAEIKEAPSSFNEVILFSGTIEQTRLEVRPKVNLTERCQRPVGKAVFTFPVDLQSCQRPW